MRKVEEKVSDESLEEVEEIIKSQRLIDQLVVENSDKIRLIEKEIKSIESRKNILEDNTDKKDSEINEGKRSICRHFNNGYCKYKDNCKFNHPCEKCDKYMRGEKCLRNKCFYRHCRGSSS